MIEDCERCSGCTAVSPSQLEFESDAMMSVNVDVAVVASHGA
jgi:hypothetical protein